VRLTNVTFAPSLAASIAMALPVPTPAPRDAAPAIIITLPSNLPAMKWFP
jgi:hypothetical protein